MFLLMYFPGIRPDLQSGLHENSHLFKKLLINPARSKDDLAALKRAPVDGIRLPVLAQADGADGESHVRKIPSQVLKQTAEAVGVCHFLAHISHQRHPKLSFFSVHRRSSNPGGSV